MKYLDNVDSEGGPFLVADAKVARDWHGVEEGGSDYDRVCRMFSTDPDIPGGLTSVGLERALVWETGGAGTGDVFLNGQDQLIIVRAWLDDAGDADDADELKTVTALAEVPPNGAINIGSLRITSGVLAILWSPESGECIESLDVNFLDDDRSKRPSGDMATDASGLLVKVEIGSYTCLHDEIELGNASARRCHLIKQETANKV